MKNRDFQELVDHNLSGLVWDERKRRQVLQAISEEEKPVKKISASFILVAAILCVSLTALAAGLVFSPGYEAARVANRAMEEQYGITAELLSLFQRTVEQNADGTVTVTYTAPEADFPAGQMGDYTVLVKGNQATVSWTNEGKSTDGGLMAEAFGAEQLSLLSRDYAKTMQTLREAGKFEPIAGADVIPNPRLQGEIEWTEEDQAEADRAEAEAQAQDESRLAEIAKAEAAGRYRVEDAASLAREAIIQEYALNEAQQAKLQFEPDSTWITGGDDQPVAMLLFWLWQDDEGQFTEKDGQYWVSVNLADGVIKDILYDTGLAGNG